MSKETTMATAKSEAPKFDRSNGVLPGVAHLALDVADRGQSTAIAVLNDARVELRAAVESGIEMAEKLAQSAFRFARKLTQRVDEASADALTGVERAVGEAVKSARETTRVAQELAAKATNSVTGKQASA